MGPIGAEFTPIAWARWFIQEYNLVEKWLGGATVLDPTAGEGNLLQALLQQAQQQGRTIKQEHLGRLFAIERENNFIEKCRQNLPEIPGNNIIQADYLLTENKLKVDIILANPPWMNFTDLPANYKSKLKPIFKKYKMISSKADVLLGNARVDIAALVIAKAIRDNLEPKGWGYFFTPLSLFFNDGAHESFRKLLSKVKLDKIYDLTRAKAFAKVATHYGFACFQNGSATQYPIEKIDLNAQKQIEAKTQLVPTGPLGSGLVATHAKLTKDVPILKQPPRQGVNTCGANKYFIFQNTEIQNEQLLEVESPLGKVQLPTEFLYPLVDNRVLNKENGSNQPASLILLPYDRNTGKPLNAQQIKESRALNDYLGKIEHILRSRKGTMIQAQIKRGIWWSLFGIGAYSFMPYKVIWRAFASKELKPIIVTHYQKKPWQANQALHAYIPCASLGEAEKLQAFLGDDEISEYLRASSLRGSKSWAQPGKIKSLFQKRSPGNL